MNHAIYVPITVRSKANRLFGNGYILLISWMILLTSCTLSGGEENCVGSDACAPPQNEKTVPKVIGTTVQDACLELDRSGYVGWLDYDGGDSNTEVERREVIAQDPDPGFRGAEDQPVKVVVSGQFIEKGLPPESGCIDYQP